MSSDLYDDMSMPTLTHNNKYKFRKIETSNRNPAYIVSIHTLSIDCPCYASRQWPAVHFSLFSAAESSLMLFFPFCVFKLRYIYIISPSHNPLPAPAMNLPLSSSQNHSLFLWLSYIWICMYIYIHIYNIDLISLPRAHNAAERTIYKYDLFSSSNVTCTHMSSGSITCRGITN